jgi:ammonium transporter, Amt family
LTGVFADESANPVISGLKEGLFFNQVKACLVTIALAVVATAVIAFIVKAVIGLRASPEVETQGLDTVEHGEEGYILE